MTAAAAWTLAVPATAAIIGLFISYWSNLRLARRKDQLERVDDQLREFYGPMLALVSASGGSWEILWDKYRPGDREYWDANPTSEQAEAWRRWMSVVFMPLNRQMRDLIVNKAHLLEETEMPACLLKVCTHVSAYEPILERWSNGDFSEHAPEIPYPRSEIEPYAKNSFTKLKSRRGELLRRSR